MVFHGPATIEGTVRESVVVFDGLAEISGTVDGDVVVFNGPVVVRSGATIGGDLVTVETPTVEPGATVRGEQRGVRGRFDWADIGFAGRFAWWVGYSVSTLLLGLLLLLLAPALDEAIARAARERTGAAIGLGAAAFFLLPIAAVLFLVIVVAIPLGLFLLLALALLYTVGYVAAAHALGRRLVATADVAVPRVPRRVGDPARARLDPRRRRARVDPRLDLRAGCALGGGSQIRIASLPPRRRCPRCPRR